MERFEIRLVLSASIILSLLPFEWVRAFDPVFLGLFGLEFLLRAVVLSGRGRGVPRPRAPHRSRAGGVALLVADLMALISFIPFSASEGARWLRLFRLTRMVLLVGYWLPLVRDLWSVLVRRERARQVMLMAIVVGGLSFAGAVILDHAESRGVDYDDDEQLTPDDRRFVTRLWWAFRQIQDPGNMLARPSATDAVVVSLGLTIFGLFLVSFLIGLGTDVVRELLELSRLRGPGMHGHTVVVNVAPSTEVLLRELMSFHRKRLPFLREDGDGGGGLGTDFVVVGQTAEPPDFLRQPDLARVVYRERGEDDESVIERADALEAQRVVLLADHHDPEPDTETVRALLSLAEGVRESVPGNRTGERLLIAEILDDSNVEAARKAASSAVTGVPAYVIPTEKLAALFLVAVLRRRELAPLLQELLTSRGHELYTCFFPRRDLAILEREPQAVLDWLLAKGLAASNRVIPVALLGETATDEDAVVGIPEEERADAPSNGRYLGFAAVADSVDVARAFTETLARSPKEGREGVGDSNSRAKDPRVTLVRVPSICPKRTVVCGFRPGSVHLLEGLICAEPGSEVLLLLADARERDSAIAELDARARLAACDALESPHGRFERVENDWADGHAEFEFTPSGDANGQEARPGRVHVVEADWVQDRNLVDLPLGFGHVRNVDAVVLVADRIGDSDPRIATALMKLDGLARGRVGRKLRVVAEVFDTTLARHLETRLGEDASVDAHVFSVQEMRALFLFQSIIVPGFDQVYAELLGSWGRSFIRLRPAAGSQGDWSFVDMARQLRRQQVALLAVELEVDGATELCVAPSKGEAGDRFAVRDVVGAWVVAAEDGPMAYEPGPVGAESEA